MKKVGQSSSHSFTWVTRQRKLVLLLVVQVDSTRNLPDPQTNH